ncbi:MAG: hypothetical protein ACREUY_10585 [Burkholderiales bacterium]
MAAYDHFGQKAAQCATSPLTIEGQPRYPLKFTKLPEIHEAKLRRHLNNTYRNNKKM